MGALTFQGEPVRVVSIFVLFILNALVVAFGFIHNDLTDKKFDKYSSDHSKRPLLAGTVTHLEAVLLTLFCLLVAVIIHYFYFHKLDSLVLLLAAFSSTALYNFTGKRLVGADISYAAATAFVAAFGYLAIPGASFETLLHTPLILALMISLFSNHLFLNAIEGGLKDIRADKLAGAKTFAISSGVSIDGDRLSVSSRFKFSAWLLKVLALSACWIPIIIDVVTPLWWQWILIVGFSALSLFRSYQIITITLWSREIIGRMSQKQESASLAIFVMILLPQAGLGSGIALIVGPFLCYGTANLLLHRKFLPNSPTM
jgi:4-hydroxybenzoate polyprenyltransferase